MSREDLSPWSGHRSVSDRLRTVGWRVSSSFRLVPVAWLVSTFFISPSCGLISLSLLSLPISRTCFSLYGWHRANPSHRIRLESSSKTRRRKSRYAPTAGYLSPMSPSKSQVTMVYFSSSALTFSRLNLIVLDITRNLSTSGWVGVRHEHVSLVRASLLNDE